MVRGKNTIWGRGKTGTIPDGEAHWRSLGTGSTLARILAGRLPRHDSRHRLERAARDLPERALPVAQDLPVGEHAPQLARLQEVGGIGGPPVARLLGGVGLVDHHAARLQAV